MELYSYGNKKQCQLPKMEDAIHIEHINGFYIFIVADANGGTEGGVNSGQLAVNIMLNYLHKAITTSTSIKDIETILDIGFYTVSQAILSINAIDNKYENVYCSMSVLIVSDTTYQACLGSVGNTEIAMIRNSKFSRLNEVHSQAYQALQSGKIEEADFYIDPGRSILTSALGVFPEVRCDIMSIGRLSQDDIILMTTDGIYRYYTPDKVIEILGTASSIDDGVNDVLKIVDEAGGEDNASLIVIHLY